MRAKVAAFRAPPPKLQISSITPTQSATSGDITLTLRGTLFKNGSRVLIGKINCASIQFISDTELNCQVPKTFSSTVDISVVNPNGEIATIENSFVFADTFMAPTIHKVTPREGSINGSTVLTISGSNFRSGASVKVGEKSCLSVKLVSAATIICETPPAGPGQVNVTVQDSEGFKAMLNSVYTYAPPETYSALKADVFTNRCSSCHGNSGGFSTQIYSQIISKVSRGNPTGSLLYQQVFSGLMPQGGEPLSQVEKQKIFDWILDGAKDN